MCILFIFMLEIVQNYKFYMICYYLYNAKHIAL